MKVGVYTFYNNYNYGSLLQCFAMQEQLKKMNTVPFVVNPMNKGGIRALKRLFHIIDFACSCVRFPNQYAEYKRFSNESNRSCRDITESTKLQFDSFIKKYLDIKDLSDSDIHKLSKQTSDYRFITGSDQVWGIGTPYLNPHGFLRNAVSKNRYSYAASFGADNCPEWNRNKLKRYLKGMTTLSVREEKGLEIINSFGIDGGQIHIDPVFLLDKTNWKSIELSMGLENYCFLFLLNEVNDVELNYLIKECKDKTVYYGPYKSKIIEKIEAAKYIEFSPEEFIWLIDNSECVFTDSFHAMAFSIIFSKQFCVLERNYQHGMPQNNRIITLLRLFGLEGHLLKNNQFEKVKYNCDEIILRERSNAEQYLRLIVTPPKR